MSADEIIRRPPFSDDAPGMWRLVEESTTLDHNSGYVYLLVAEMFAQSSTVALQQKRIVGLVTGFRVPGRTDTLFVWQMRVDAIARGRGLALAMIEDIIDRLGDDISFVEATVDPANVASCAVFAALARKRGGEVSSEPFVREGDFPNIIGAPHDENRLTIGPFRRPPVEAPE